MSNRLEFLEGEIVRLQAEIERLRTREWQGVHGRAKVQTSGSLLVKINTPFIRRLSHQDVVYDDMGPCFADKNWDKEIPR